MEILHLPCRFHWGKRNWLVIRGTALAGKEPQPRENQQLSFSPAVKSRRLLCKSRQEEETAFTYHNTTARQLENKYTLSDCSLSTVKYNLCTVSCSAAFSNLQPMVKLETFSVYLFHLAWWLLHEINQREGNAMPSAIRMLRISWRKRSLWNPQYCLMLFILKRAALESCCDTKNIYETLWDATSLLCKQTAGSWDTISGHVLSCRGPFTEQKADVEHLILTGTEHRLRIPQSMLAGSKHTSVQPPFR